jgi:hypothetical protein
VGAISQLLLRLDQQIALEGKVLLLDCRVRKWRNLCQPPLQEHCPRMYVPYATHLETASHIMFGCNFTKDSGLLLDLPLTMWCPFVMPVDAIFPLHSALDHCHPSPIVPMTHLETHKQCWFSMDISPTLALIRKACRKRNLRGALAHLAAHVETWLCRCVDKIRPTRPILILI